MIDPDEIEEAKVAAAAAAGFPKTNNGNVPDTRIYEGDYEDEPDSKRRKTSNKSEAQLKGEEERRKFARAQEEMFKDERAQSKIDHIKHLQKIAAEKSSFRKDEDDDDDSRSRMVDDEDDNTEDTSSKSLRIGERDTWTGKDEDKRIRGGVEEATLDEEGHITKLGYEEDEGGDFNNDGYMHDGDIRIEPFNLKKERETGYFDESGFYIDNSRKEERDPWLDEEYDKVYAKELERPENKAKILRNLMREKQTYDFDFGSSDSDSDTDNDGKPSKECRFLQTIVRLLNKDTETVSDGLRRLGNKKSKDANEDDFNDLTDAADGLLGLGNMGIYSETKASLTKLLGKFVKEIPPTIGTTGTGVQQQGKLWEYKFVNGDGTLQGPFTSQQMAFWQAQGFFSGSYEAVVRPAKGKPNSLLDDLEEDENGGNDFVKADTIDFSKM